MKTKCSHEPTGRSGGKKGWIIDSGLITKGLKDQAEEFKLDALEEGPGKVLKQGRDMF